MGGRQRQQDNSCLVIPSECIECLCLEGGQSCSRVYPPSTLYRHSSTLLTNTSPSCYAHFTQSLCEVSSKIDFQLSVNWKWSREQVFKLPAAAMYCRYSVRCKDICGISLEVGEGGALLMIFSYLIIYYSCKSDRARKLLKYEPIFTVEEGIILSTAEYHKSKTH